MMLIFGATRETMFVATALRRASSSSSSMRVGGVVAQSIRNCFAINASRVVAVHAAPLVVLPKRAYALPAHGGKLLNLIDASKQTVMFLKMTQM
jgi:hypothetical protein